MANVTPRTPSSESADWVETQEWIDALRDVSRSSGPERASSLLQSLQIAAQRLGMPLPVTSRTLYLNTIPGSLQPDYPGNLATETRIKSIIRWNAMAMVSEANGVLRIHSRMMIGIGTPNPQSSALAYLPESVAPSRLCAQSNIPEFLEPP